MYRYRDVDDVDADADVVVVEVVAAALAFGFCLFGFDWKLKIFYVQKSQLLFIFIRKKLATCLGGSKLALGLASLRVVLSWRVPVPVLFLGGSSLWEVLI